MKFIPTIALLGLIASAVFLVTRDQPAGTAGLQPTSASPTASAPGKGHPTQGDVAAVPTVLATQPQPARSDSEAAPPPPEEAELAAAPVFYTHHRSLHAAYPQAFRPLVVIVESDFDHAEDGLPPSIAAIDASFQPGGKAYEKVIHALATEAMVVDDGEWMPSHMPPIDYDALDAAIEAKLRVVSHIRRLADELPVALYGPISDPRLWVGLAGHERGDRYWSNKHEAELVPRQAGWDEMWAICIERLIPAYDVLAFETYPMVRHADFYPAEPERWWELADWLPKHIEQMKLAGLPVVPYVWYRYNSQHFNPAYNEYFPLADLSYLSELVDILKEHDINEIAMWMAWNHRLDIEAQRRIDLILSRFRGVEPPE